MEKDYRLESFAFQLVAATVSFRELPLQVMREMVLEKQFYMLGTDSASVLDAGDVNRQKEYDNIITDAHQNFQSPDLNAKKQHVFPDNFTKEERLRLGEYMMAIAKEYDKLYDVYQAFNRYYNMKDFIKDSAKTGQLLADSFSRLDEQYCKLRDSMIIYSSKIYKNVYQTSTSETTKKRIRSAMRQSIQSTEAFSKIAEQHFSYKYRDIKTLNKLDALVDSLNDIKVKKWNINYMETPASIWDYVLLNPDGGSTVNLSPVTMNARAIKNRTAALKSVVMGYLNSKINREKQAYKVFNLL